MDLRELKQAYTQTLVMTGRQWRRVADTVAERHGINEAKALPLVMMARMGDAPRQNALAEAVGVEGPTLVRLLDQLEKAGMVVRKEDPGDRRAKVLSLTKAGSRVVAEMEVELDRVRGAMFADVSPADLEASLRVFRTVQDFATRASADDVAPGEAAE